MRTHWYERCYVNKVGVVEFGLCFSGTFQWCIRIFLPGSNSRVFRQKVEKKYFDFGQSQTYLIVKKKKDQKRAKRKPCRLKISDENKINYFFFTCRLMQGYHANTTSPFCAKGMKINLKNMRRNNCGRIKIFITLN